jgi:magnesium-transporting ATPase (P-type)
VGVTTPLIARQILAVNAITDILPALAVALQQPEHRNLAGLHREGEASLNKPLCSEVIRRGIATTLPSLISYLVMLGSGLPQARSVAFASIVATQLAQTLDSGWSEGTLTKPVLSAVAGSVGVLLATFTVPPLRAFLQLALPSPFGWALIGTGAVAAVGVNRVLDFMTSGRPAFAPLHAPPAQQMLPAPAQ